MSNQESNSKRIAKNTLLLYFRMILIMVVSLYTSRIILNELGVEDFGIYNLVAGVVILFSFLSNAMITATQRYLSIAIGKKDEKYIQAVFSTSLLSHFFLIFFIFLAAETIGLWLINAKLEIPADRMSATNFVYQLAILTTCVNIIRIPYNASIIANERMFFFAYVSIVETFLKLAVVWALAITPGDKLVIYSFLLLLVAIVIDIAYWYYCQRFLLANKFYLKTNKKLFVELTSFSVWNLFGGLADIGYKQGTNIILNLFWGVSINAVLGITNQIRNALVPFIGNLQLAVNPQMVKSYALGDYEYFKILVYRISKYSYFLMLIIVFPIIFNIDLILELWLKNPPEHTAIFAMLTSVYCLVDSLTGPLWAAMQAGGKIKRFQIVTGICLLLNLPVSYLFLMYGYAPSVVLIIQIVITGFTVGVRVLFVKYYLQFSIRNYVREVIFPIVFVTVLSLPIALYIYAGTGGYYRLLLFILFVPIMCCIIYVCGTCKNEKEMVMRTIRTKFLKRKQ